MVIKIKKRDGRVVPFNFEKIAQAINKSLIATNSGTYDDALVFAGEVVDRITETTPSVEIVQDVVEKVLMEKGKSEAAKAYILYRSNRTRVREMDSDLMKTLEKLTFEDAKSNDLKRENANIDGDTAMGTMLKYGTSASKEFYSKFILDPKHAKAHTEGDIHIHDLDFYTLTTTCTQIDLTKLFKNGFSTGHGYLRTPSCIQSYAALACIAIQSNQNDQHGGQSIPKFDYDMAEGVAKSFERHYVKNLGAALSVNFEVSDSGLNGDELAKSVCEEAKAVSGVRPAIAISDEYKNAERKSLLKYKINEDFINRLQEFAYERALKDTERETYQAMEALIHNLNTMNSRAGAQVPFSSINYGTDTSPEGRMVIKNILLAEEAGLGNGETPIFPIHIFKVKDGVNYNPTDPNYDLFKLACRVSAKRLFPNFSFIDAPFNLQYYKPGNPDTEIAYMGCVQGDEVITYKMNGKVYVEGIARATSRVIKKFPEKTFIGKGTGYVNTDGAVEIYDSNAGRFVNCKKFIINSNRNNWKQIKFSDGRCLLATEDHPLPVVSKGRTYVKDMVPGDKVYSKPLATFVPETEDIQNVLPDGVPATKKACWLLGMLLCDSSYANNICISLGPDETDIIHKVTFTINELRPDFRVSVKEQNRGAKGSYFDVNINAGKNLSKMRGYLTKAFDGIKKSERHIPNEIFTLKEPFRRAFLAGMFDADGYMSSRTGADGTVICRGCLGSTNKELALQQMYLIQSIGLPAKMYMNRYSKKHNKIRYLVEFEMDKDFCSYVTSYKKSCVDIENCTFSEIKMPDTVTVISITDSDCCESSFDVETETDRFDVSGLMSHNCRTRVIGNNFDPSREIVTGRGNLSFTSINLPRLAIKAKGNVGTFFDSLDEMMDLCIEQLMHRFRIQASKKVKNYPFLMGQGVWIDSDKLDVNDEVGEVLKHGTLSVGFIGLAECLKSLIGKHHGESEEARELGMEIVTRMRERMDEESKRTGLNFSLLATPAEGLSGRFLRMDKERYGEIAGVTDRDYYTNSFHVPVYYNIGAFDKIKIEAPYHALTNAGHISYIELDGDPTTNLNAFEKIVRCMKEQGIGYGAINHPVDRDPVCGYTGIIGDKCPMCGRTEAERQVAFERIRRITGYLVGTIDRFNNAKRAEVNDRVKHNVCNPSEEKN